MYSVTLTYKVDLTSPVRHPPSSYSCDNIELIQVTVDVCNSVSMIRSTFNLGVYLHGTERFASSQAWIENWSRARTSAKHHRASSFILSFPVSRVTLFGLDDIWPTDSWITTSGYGHFAADMSHTANSVVANDMLQPQAANAHWTNGIIFLF